jgi:hypothetical protein
VRAEGFSCPVFAEVAVQRQERTVWDLQRLNRRSANPRWHPPIGRPCRNSSVRQDELSQREERG